MAGLTQKEIKKALGEALEPFARATQKDFERIDKRLDKVDGRLDKVDGRLDKVDGRLDRVEEDLSQVKKDVKWMKDNSSELFAKLDQFIGLYEKHEQELIILAGQMRRLEERMAKLEAQQGAG